MRSRNIRRASKLKKERRWSKEERTMERKRTDTAFVPHWDTLQCWYVYDLLPSQYAAQGYFIVGAMQESSLMRGRHKKYLVPAAFLNWSASDTKQSTQLCKENKTTRHEYLVASLKTCKKFRCNVIGQNTRILVILPLHNFFFSSIGLSRYFSKNDYDMSTSIINFPILFVSTVVFDVAYVSVCL